MNLFGCFQKQQKKKKKKLWKTVPIVHYYEVDYGGPRRDHGGYLWDNGDGFYSAYRWERGGWRQGSQAPQPTVLYVSFPMNEHDARMESMDLWVSVRKRILQHLETCHENQQFHG